MSSELLRFSNPSPSSPYRYFHHTAWAHTRKISFTSGYLHSKTHFTKLCFSHLCLQFNVYYFITSIVSLSKCWGRKIPHRLTPEWENILPMQKKKTEKKKRAPHFHLNVLLGDAATFLLPSLLPFTPFDIHSEFQLHQVSALRKFACLWMWRLEKKKRVGKRKRRKKENG